MTDFITPGAFVLVGLVVLVLGGESLVRGASRLAWLARISPLVIGLTVVAFGTSAPELAVSVKSAYAGSPDIAVGNVVGSNIANILLILGLSAAVASLTVSSQLVRFDVPIMIGASLLFYLFAFDGEIVRWEGGVLFSLLLIYVVWSIYKSRSESAEVQEHFEEAMPHGITPGGATVLRQIGFILVGLVGLALGASWLVEGASDIARLLGVSELIIGLTIVAIGTSLPELVASIVASLRGERDIAVGNVVGSNLFNLLCVIGLASIVAPDGIAVSREALHFDMPIMIIAAVACLPIFFTGNSIDRWEGALFFGYYILYLVYLVLAATDSPLVRDFVQLMVVFVIPLTVLTIAATVIHSFVRRNHS